MEENAQNLEIILQDCLRRIRSGEDTLETALSRYPQIAKDLRPLLEAALWIQSRQTALQPRPGFVSASRRRLVEQIQREQVALPASPRVSWWQNILQTLSSGFQQQHRAVQFVTALVLVLALLLSVGGTGIARASQGALPGDLLYSVKRSIEKAELALTPDEAGKAELYIQNARSRMKEVQSLLEENKTDHIDETVLLFEDHVYNAVSIMVAVKEKDTVRANQLAAELDSTLKERSGALRGLANSSTPNVNQEINRLLAVSDGMVVLMQDRFPLVAGTPAVTPTSTITPGIVVVVPSAPTPSPLATATHQPGPILVIPDPFEYTSTVTSTLIITSTGNITSTVSISSGKENPPPQSQRDKEKEKKEKKPKPEKTKKPHPDPIHRPDNPN